MRRVVIPLVLAAIFVASRPIGAAVTIDGQLDPGHGAPLSTQAIETNDHNAGWAHYSAADGSELDEAYGFIADGLLHLFLAGNLMSWTDSNRSNIYDNLAVFIDCQPGGQNQLRSDNPHLGDLDGLAGLTFDAGFEADYWIGFHGAGLFAFPDPWSAFYAQLPAGGNGVGFFLGQGTATGPGTLSGGTNPDEVQITIDNRNVAGVDPGCAAGSGAGVTYGIESSIPLTAIGNPTGCLRVCALVHYGGSWVTNQVLAPVPAGTCALMSPASVDFSIQSGEQFFTVCPPSSTPVTRPSWGLLKTTYR